VLDGQRSSGKRRRLLIRVKRELPAIRFVFIDPTMESPPQVVSQT
jgi:hypothetical protein